MQGAKVTSYFDGMKIGNVQRRFLWLTALMYIFDQYSTGAVSMAAPSLIKYHHITPAQIANINAANFLGAFLGSIFGGWMAERIGRRKALLIGICWYSIGDILNGLQTSYYGLLLTRGFTGIGMIATVVTAMVYIAEMLPSENRGKYQAITIAGGTFFLPFLNIFNSWYVPQSPENWRVAFYIGGIGFVFAILGFFWLVESPRWLVSKGRIAEAEDLVGSITGNKVDLSGESNKAAEKKSSTAETLRVMFSKNFLRRTIVLGILIPGISLGGFFIGQFYTTAMTQGGMPTATALLIVSLSTFGVPIGDFLSSFVTDRGGRKIPIATALIIKGLIGIIAGLTFNPVIIAVCLILNNLFGVASNTMSWAYLAESYPTHIRSSATGLVFGLGRLVAVASQFIVAPIFIAYGWLGLNVAGAIVVIVPAVIALIWGEKTGKRSLEELNEMVA